MPNRRSAGTLRGAPRVAADTGIAEPTEALTMLLRPIPSVDGRACAVAGCLLAALAAAPLPAQAQLMRATLTGTVIAGGDAYSNTVLLGANDGTSLIGQAASAFIVYDAAKFGPNYPGYSPNWSFYHYPDYPNFLGTVGQGPVRSAGFTVNGITLNTDVSGLSETARLSVENRVYAPGYGEQDNWTLYGGDARFRWCPNDGQCSETLQLSASQTYETADMFGGQRPFDPADSFSTQASTYRTLMAYVRLYRAPVCGTYDECPHDGVAADNQAHWVEFYIGGPNARLTVAPAVPEPGSWALWLAGAAVLVGELRRRRRSG